MVCIPNGPAGGPWPKGAPRPQGGPLTKGAEAALAKGKPGMPVDGVGKRGTGDGLLFAGIGGGG